MGGRVGGPVRGGQKVVGCGIIHGVRVEAAACELRRHGIRKGLTYTADAEGFTRPSGEDDLDVGTRVRRSGPKTTDW